MIEIKLEKLALEDNLKDDLRRLVKKNNKCAESQAPPNPSGFKKIVFRVCTVLIDEENAMIGNKGDGDLGIVRFRLSSSRRFLQVWLNVLTYCQSKSAYRGMY